ncbi:glycosyltransferase [bacterium]|nr:glycosyltransferase [bacterium]
MALKISVVVLIGPKVKFPDNINILKKWKEKGMEIIMVKGLNPTLLWNKGITHASGDIIYFLDKDSQPAWGNIEIIKDEFSNKDTDILGGPQLLPQEGPQMEEIYYDILSTPVLSGNSAPRFSKRGERRVTNDSELIFSNIAIRKKVFSEIGNLNENIYPNALNAFLHKAKKRGCKIIYDPKFFVEKQMKLSVIKFIKTIFKSGFGRGIQTKKDFKSINIFKFLFILFAPLFIMGFFIDPLEYILFAYFLFDILIAMLLSNWSFFTFFHYLFLIPIFHFTGSIGIFFGLFLKNPYIGSNDIEINML